MKDDNGNPHLQLQGDFNCSSHRLNVTPKFNKDLSIIQSTLYLGCCIYSIHQILTAFDTTRSGNAL
jgi:hypothetical protein